MSWNIAKILEWATGYFSEKSIDTPRLDTELLLAKALNLSRVQLYVQFDRPLSEAELADFKALLQRRVKREPLAYILGEREFYSLSFRVSPAVLIPRPETEGIVEESLTHLKSGSFQNPQILDLATGSGCILISILKNFSTARGIGVDLSISALEVSKQNAKFHGLADRSIWLEQDLRKPWSQDLAGPFAVITANLPYVSTSDWEALPPELHDFEPREALTPGPAGTEAFEWILPQLSTRLVKQGLALLEIGADQGESLLDRVKVLCTDLHAEVKRDLAGHPRILSLRKD